MNKALTIIFVLLTVSPAVCQKPDGTRVFLVEQIVDSIPHTKAQIRERIKSWIGTNFKSGKDVIVSDTEDLIVGNYITTRNGTVGNQVHWEQTMTVDIKDGRIRVRIWVNKTIESNYDAALFWYGKHKPTKLHQRWLDEMMMESSAIISNLKQHLRAKREDW